MRIACIHLPQLSLQHATRLDPSLRGAPVAVVGGGERGSSRPLAAPIVIACSRAAWAIGVRLGMTATTARALSPALSIVSIDAAAERETVRALADALLAITPTVDLGGRVGAGGAHLAMYIEVPQKLRGHAFGERVLDLVGALGLTARVGIADDRFTAWVAAAYGPHGTDPDEHVVIAVPRGGSAAFLAPRPLSLLAISPEVLHMLEALGVTTLGEFAALPAPSVARPTEADYQALARGESGTALRPYVPEGPIREEMVVGAGNVLDSANGLSGPAAIAMVARRIALRLAGRSRCATRLDVTVDAREVPIELDRPIAEPEELARALQPAVGEASATAWRLRVVVEPASGEEATLPSFSDAGRRLPDADPLAVVLSTTGTLFTLAAPERRDAHRRTRRGKQRRIRPTPSAQSRLFER